MKKNRTTETIIYEGLGFPIRLANVPMKKVFGELVLDINLGKFQRDVLHILAYKDHPLNGAEVRFIRKYFELTTTAFGKAFGVTHAAVLKWEAGQGRIPATTELCIRLFILDKLQAKNEEFGKLYHKVTIDSLAQHQKQIEDENPLEFDANQKRAFA
jgi:DNA-binding transcriptional regulator YiaG